MRVIHVSSNDIEGGAARATYRLHRALLDAGLTSRMLVHARASDDNSVDVCGPERYGRINDLRRAFHRWRWTAFSSGDTSYFTRADDNWGFGDRLSSTACDLVHLHWLGSTTLTIEEIGSIRQPVVWTLHDMWGFCGAEHYVLDSDEARFRTGYHAGNRPLQETGPDLNQWVWQRKLASWKRSMTIVSPSRWLAGCARDSVLFKGWPIHHIPNPIDTGRWCPHPRDWARALLGLPAAGRIVMFGAMGGEGDLRKGGDLLREALQLLHARDVQDLHLVIFGQSPPAVPAPLPYPVTYLGRLHDDASMITAYNAADVMLVPSRQDNLPQTAVEAQACGIPVVAFNIGGMPDVVEHGVSGFLARPYDIGELAEGIEWVLGDEQRCRDLGATARKGAVEKYSPPAIAAAYQELYGQVLRQKVG